jgi:PAS domain S-box-containing protein
MKVYSTLKEQLPAELSQSQNFLQQLINNSPDIIYVLNINDVRFTYINNRIDQLSVIDPKYNQGHDFFLDLLHPDDYIKRIEHIKSCKQLQDGDVKEIEVRWKMKDGSWHWFRIRDGVYKRDAEGNVSEIVGIARDINEKKISRLELEEKVHFINAIAETSPDIMILYDLEESKIVYITKDIFQLLGYKYESILQMDKPQIYSIIHPDDIKKVHLYQKSFVSAADDDIKEVEYRIKRINNEWVWFHSRGKVFKRDSVGNVIQYISILRDVTQQKKTIESLIESERLSAIGSFVRTIAHEVRNPLTNINLALAGLENELADKLNENAEAKTFFEIISRNSGNINILIKKLLLSSKQEADELIKVDLAVLLDEVIGISMDTIVLREVNIEKHYSYGYFIMANPEKLTIAITNIIVNGIEAMDAHKGLLKLCLERENDSIILSVSDNGCGMTKEQQQRIFDAYYSSKPAGLGIGLANAKKILEYHNAVIKVNSQEGKGTTFRLQFNKA